MTPPTPGARHQHLQHPPRHPPGHRLLLRLIKERIILAARRCLALAALAGPALGGRIRGGEGGAGAGARALRRAVRRLARRLLRGRQDLGLIRGQVGHGAGALLAAPCRAEEGLEGLRRVQGSGGGRVGGTGGMRQAGSRRQA